MAKRPSLHGTGREALVAAAAAKTARASEAPAASAPGAGPAGEGPAGMAAKRPPSRAPAESKPPVRARAAAKAAGNVPAKPPRGPKRRAGPETREGPAPAWLARFDWLDSASVLARANATLVKSAVAVCEEMVSFANARLRHNIEAGETLRRCKSPAEILEAQAEYARRAAEQYLAEPVKLMDLAAKTGKGWATMPWHV
jgi:phasin protein